MYNLRYHIASLVSVFLSLALGLILGGLVVERGTVERQQSNLVEGLRKEFATLRADNRDLAAQGEMLDALSSTLTDEWIEGRLTGASIVLVTDADRESGLDDVVAAIESAGGDVAVARVLMPGLGLGEDALRSVLDTSHVEADDPLASVATSLAAEWASPTSERPLTASLVKAGALEVDGFGDAPAGGIVTIAVTAEDPEPAGLALATAFLTYGPAVAGEHVDARVPLAVAGHEAGVAGFDTLGSPMGRYTLIAILTGAKADLYGLSEGAVEPFPRPPAK
jgi:hypothetical protein